MKYPLVQGLRGIAALWVVLFHASAAGHGLSLPTWLRPLFTLGNNGVAIFFALSGFVIAHSIRDDCITLSYIGRFALRRSLRLDPAYWASIALFIAFTAAAATIAREPFLPPSTGQLAANLTYTQLFLNYASINDVYWTLCYEVQFYLVLVFWVMAAQRFGRSVYTMPFAAAVLWGTGLLGNPMAGLFLDLWHGFFLGVLAYWAISSREARLAFCVLCVALIVSSPPIFTIVCILTSAGLLIATRSGYIERSPGRSLLFLGTISYSLYLTHNPVAGAVFFVLAKIGAPELLALPVSIAACISAATAFWFVIERPTMKLAQRVPLRQPTRVTSASEGILTAAV